MTMTTITTIAKTLKMSPKVARRKLRDAGMKPSKKHGWAFTSTKRVIATLKKA
jgi:hypothetical protein